MDAPYYEALHALKKSVDSAVILVGSDSALFNASQSDIERFKRKHPGAHMVIGDFEIKCLHPEKYGFEQ